MQAFIYFPTRCVGVCMCIYYNRKQLVMCDIIFQAHGKSMPEPIPTLTHTNREAPSCSHPGKSSTYDTWALLTYKPQQIHYLILAGQY